jgi:two-component system, LytTR family, response regulator
MKILILEDEILIAKGLIVLIKQLEPQAEIIGPMASVRETIAWLEQNQTPDLVLADIQLSDGVSFNALEKLNPKTPVIFTTAFDEYALKAFRLNSIDYLLKPIDEEELKRAFEKFHLLKEKYLDASFQLQMLQMLQGKSTVDTYKTRFMVYSGKSIIPLPTSEIAYFQKEEIIFLTTKDGRQYVTEFRSLDEIQDLIDPATFYRANRQFLILGDQIAKFETDYMGKIILTLDMPSKMQIQISKDKASDFRKWIEER